MAGLTLEGGKVRGQGPGEGTGHGAGRHGGNASLAAPWLSRGPRPPGSDPGGHGPLAQCSSPVGVHHLLQLVIEDKLGVPGESAHAQWAWPGGRPRLAPHTAARGPTSPGAPRGASARGSQCPSAGRTVLYCGVKPPVVVGIKTHCKNKTWRPGIFLVEEALLPREGDPGVGTGDPGPEAVVHSEPRCPLSPGGAASWEEGGGQRGRRAVWGRLLPAAARRALLPRPWGACSAQWGAQP